MIDILKPGDKGGGQQRLILGGFGGIGKTQLAIDYARCHHNVYKSVLWLHAASEAAVKDSFRSIAELIFGVQEPGVLDDEQIPAQVRRWLSDVDNTQWLLIFDNYDDPSQFQIEQYYPSASHGTTIVTTRRPDRVAGLDLRVGPLQNQIDDGLKILQSRSRRENVASDRFAKLLATRLAGLPLALATAGAYLHKSSLTFQQYLQDEDRDAATLLRVLAYFDNQSLWYDLLRAGLGDAPPDAPTWLHKIMADSVKFDSVMRGLAEYCFVEVQETSWSMHNCVHVWTLAVLSKEINAEHYWYAFGCVAASVGDADWDSFGHPSFARFAAHARQLTQERFNDGEIIRDGAFDRLEEILTVAHLLQQQIQLTASEQIYLRALAGREKALGPKHRSTLDTANNLGILHSAQGKLTLAEQYYQRALGPEHTSTLMTVIRGQPSPSKKSSAGGAQSCLPQPIGAVPRSQGRG